MRIFPHATASDKVSSGLVSGIYGRKATIEREVSAAVPKLIAQMEEKDLLQTRGW